MSSMTRSYQRLTRARWREPDARSRSLLVVFLRAGLCVALAQRRELFRDPRFEAAIGRLVERDLGHAFRQIMFAGGVRFRLVVRVTVPLAVAEVLHEARRRVPDVQRHGPRAVL